MTGPYTRTINGREFTAIPGGGYFDEDGSRVPLSDRPDELVSGVIEQALRDNSNVLDVEMCGGQAMVLVTGSADSVLETVKNETPYRFKKSIDKSRDLSADHHTSMVFRI